jgi:hypothetical protein
MEASESESKMSQPGNGSRADEEVGAVAREVEVVDAGFEAKDAEAEADVNDESALGRRTSGVMVVSSVSQGSSGLRLRSRSPSPSTSGVRSGSSPTLGTGPSTIRRRMRRRRGNSYMFN